METNANTELDTFIADWQATPERNRDAFLRFRNCLAAKEGVTLEFIARPGVTYSLRATHAAQKKRGLFVMVDVIEDAPRWLSICFYGEMITDPDGMGDAVPGGLLGEDAVCFDLDQYDEDRIRYIEGRMDEAHHSAARE